MAFISFQLQEGRNLRTRAIADRMRAALPREVLEGIATTVRRGGPGSFRDQFDHQAEMAASVSVPWARTRDFGTRKAPPKTMHDRGALEAAWTGTGPGGVTIFGPNSVVVGVDSRRFPQAPMHQRGGITLIRITPKARLYVGLTFGVWMRRDKTRFLVEGRPLSLNREILRRARTIIGRWYLRGMLPGESVARDAAVAAELVA